MSPLDPKLREMLRRSVPLNPVPEVPPLGFAAAVRAQWHREQRLAAPVFPDRILAAAAALSMALIVVGATLLFQVALRPEHQPAWVSASQFAASQLMP